MVAQEGAARGEETVLIIAKRLFCKCDRHSRILNGLPRRDYIQRDNGIEINGVSPNRLR
jgi:hypothetical protein